MEHEGIRKIAVLRANGLGDLLFALPALEALRARFSDAFITLLGRPLHQVFLADRPSPVDRVYVIPTIPGVVAGTPAPQNEIDKFLVRMRKERFDVAVQIHGGGRFSNPLVRSLGASLTVGLRTPDAAPLDFDVPYIYYQHEVHRYLEVVARLGAPPLTFHPRIEATARDLKEADHVLPPATDQTRLLVIHPGARDPRRRWSPSKFARVGDVLARAGATVVLVGDRSEQSLCRRVQEKMDEHAHDLSGRIGLGGLIGTIARASLAVGNDSGPLHVATALGRPAVAIFWCGNVINAGAPFRSDFRPCLSWQLNCSVCGADCTEDGCPHDTSFVDRVGVEEVLEQALDLWRRADGGAENAGPFASEGSSASPQVAAP